jgi:CHAT domain-containing protein/Tfp pilus assembly protein PilF
MCPKTFRGVLALALAGVLWLGVVTPAAQAQIDLEALRRVYDRARALERAGKPKEAIAEFEKMLALATRMAGADHPGTAAVMENLANVCRGQGQLDRAEALLRRALEVFRARLGKTHPATAGCMLNLANVYVDRKHYPRAEALLKESLAILEERRGKDHLEVALALNNLAAVYWAQARDALAEPVARRALAIREARLPRDHLDVADSLSLLGRIQAKLPRAALQAEASFRRALAIYEAQLGKDHLKVADCLRHLGRLLDGRKQYAQARACLRRGLEIFETRLGGKHLEVADTLADLVACYRTQGDLARAEPLARRSLQIRQERLGRDDLRVVAARLVLAQVYAARYRPAEAEALYQECLRAVAGKSGLARRLAVLVYWGLAGLAEEEGDDARADDYQRRGLKLLQAEGKANDPWVAFHLYQAALACEKQGRLARAAHLLEEGLAIHDAHPEGRVTDRTACLDLLARVYRRQGLLARSEQLFQRCVKAWEEETGPDSAALAECLLGLGLLYEDQGRPARAEPVYRRALAIMEKTFGPDHPHVGRSLNILAGVYLGLNEPARAEPLLRRSLKVHEAASGPNGQDVASVLHNLAVLYQDRGRYDQAAPLVERSLKIIQGRYGPADHRLASTLQILGRNRAATGDWAGAGEALDRARRLSRRHVGRELSALPEAEQLAYLRKNDEAGFHFSLSVGWHRRRQADLAGQSAAWLLNGKGVAHQALAERTLLTRDSTDPRLRDASRQLVAVRQRLAALTLAPCQPGEEADQRRQLARLAEQEQELSRRQARARGQTGREQEWIELRDVRRALSPDAVLIELARFRLIDFKAGAGERKQPRPRYAAWIIPALGRGEVRLVDLGPAEKIDEAVQAARRTLRRAARDIRQRGEPEAERELRRPLEALARLVLHPLTAHAGQARRWVLSPDASLWLVPWAALPLPDGRYAIEKYRLHYVVSGRDLVTGSPTGEAGPPVILADPDYDSTPRALRAEPAKSSGLPRLRSPGPTSRLSRARRLPGTAAEARAIGPRLERYCGRRPLVHLDRHATEAAVKAVRRPRVLVLSTHGFFLADQEVPASDHGGMEGKRAVLTTAGGLIENPLLRCGLLLAGCNRRAETLKATGDDGVLTGLEIVGCDLRGCELVVLSACDTGLGAVRNGEGVAGLRQAFQLAGARAVLATLWQIPDRETARLMRDFFARLAGGQGKAEALRQAQLALLKARRARHKAAHPFFWAAFTLTGQGEK